MILNNLIKARDLAVECHEGQMRKWGDEKAITHSIEVSNMAIERAEELKLPDEEVADIGIAAILHDTIEDGEVDNIRYKIRDMFGDKVYQIVDDLTRTEEGKYWEYLDKLIKEGRLESLLIKYCDMIHNISTLPLNVGLHNRYTKAMNMLYPVLEKKIKERKLKCQK